jgi:hypothetical protein
MKKECYTWFKFEINDLTKLYLQNIWKNKKMMKDYEDFDVNNLMKRIPTKWYFIKLMISVNIKFMFIKWKLVYHSFFTFHNKTIYLNKNNI